MILNGSHSDIPAQSLGADVIIVQGGEDAADDGTLLVSPVNHGCFLVCVQALARKRLNGCSTRGLVYLIAAETTPAQGEVSCHWLKMRGVR